MERREQISTWDELKIGAQGRLSRAMNRFWYWRVMLSTLAGLAGVGGYEFFKSATQGGQVEVAVASPNFCDTTYKTIGEMKAGNPFHNLRAWDKDHFNFAPDAIAGRFDYSNQSFSQKDDATGLWINKSGDPSLPVELQVQIDPANLSQVKAGKDAATLRFGGIWQVDGNMEMFDLYNNSKKLGELKPDTRGNIVVALPENLSRIGFKFNNPHPNSIEVTVGNASIQEITDAVDNRNGFDLRGKPKSIPANPCQTSTSTETAVASFTATLTASSTASVTSSPTLRPVETSTSSATPTIFASTETPTRTSMPSTPTPSRTPEATPQPLEVIPPVAFILPQGKVNESVNGVWIDPMIFAGMDMKLTNALDGLRFSGAVLNLRQGAGQGEIWINTTSGARPIQLDFQFDQRLLKSLMQNHPAAGVFIDFPGWKNLLVEVIDESNTSNPRIVESFRLNDTGFGEAVFSDRINNSKRRFGIRINGINQETAGRVYLGSIPQWRLDLYKDGQVTNGVDVRSQLSDNPYTRIHNPAMLNEFWVPRPPVIPTPFPTPTPERAHDCSIAGPFVDAVMWPELPLDYFYSLPPNVFSRIKLTEDKFWSWGILIARQQDSDAVWYRSAGSGNVIMVTNRNVCSTELAVRTDPQYLNQYKNGEDSRVTQHVLIQAPDGTPRKALIQFIQVDGPDKGKLVLEREINGYHGFLLSDGNNPENKVIQHRMLVRPFKSEDQNVITVNFGSTSAADLRNPDLQKLQTDLTNYSSLFR